MQLLVVVLGAVQVQLQLLLRLLLVVVLLVGMWLLQVVEVVAGGGNAAGVVRRTEDVVQRLQRVVVLQQGDVIDADVQQRVVVEVIACSEQRERIVMSKQLLKISFDKRG